MKNLFSIHTEESIEYFSNIAEDISLLNNGIKKVSDFSVERLEEIRSASIKLYCRSRKFYIDSKIYKEMISLIIYKK